MKLLVGLLALALAVLLGWQLGRRRSGGTTPVNPAEQAPEPVPTVRCAHCGVHLAAAEALSVAAPAGDRHYCSAAHRDADAARP